MSAPRCLMRQLAGRGCETRWSRALQLARSNAAAADGGRGCSVPGVDGMPRGARTRTSMSSGSIVGSSVGGWSSSQRRGLTTAATRAAPLPLVSARNQQLASTAAQASSRTPSRSRTGSRRYVPAPLPANCCPYLTAPLTCPSPHLPRSVPSSRTRGSFGRLSSSSVL